jgi:hypothetical protein
MVETSTVMYIIAGIGLLVSIILFITYYVKVNKIYLKYEQIEKNKRANTGMKSITKEDKKRITKNEEYITEVKKLPPLMKYSIILLVISLGIGIVSLWISIRK